MDDRHRYPKLKTPAQVEELFDHMAPRYDFLNHLFSAGQDILWRIRAAKLLAPAIEGPILDGATGSGDLAIELARRYPDRGVTGLDFSEGMLNVARRKVEKKGAAGRVSLVQGDLMNLPLDDDTFAGGTVSFGIRNVADRLQALNELARVIRPGGSVVIVEPALPTLPVFAPVYRFYFKNVMPRIAVLFGLGDAYAYLFDSVDKFPSEAAFQAMMDRAGFGGFSATYLTLRTVVLFRGVVR